MQRALLLVLAATTLLPACSGPAAGSGEATPSDSVTLALADDPTPVADTLVVYKSASCGCCTAWVEHMEKNGFRVVVHDRNAVELNQKKAEQGVTSELTSCHTAIIAGYTVEGHVPADLVKRLLRERPDIAGLAVPGMPSGSPGMETGTKDRYDVVAFKRDGSTQVFATR